MSATDETKREAGMTQIRRVQRKKHPMAKEKMLDNLFLDTLKDIYYAVRKILRALPKMKRAAQSE